MRDAPAPLNGNGAWASRYAAELRRVLVEHAARAPRSLQTALGPSELGTACDRQAAGKMAGCPKTNHVADPWPSIRGTALHAWAAAAFEADNARLGRTRWAVERRVCPDPGHPGTADLYDAAELAVVDHKFLGESAMARLRSSGPSRKYLVQLLLYGRGYRLLGLPVRRVALAAYPATAASLDGTHVWDHPLTPADDALVDEVLARTAVREDYAELLRRRLIALDGVPASPDPSDCYFCPFYRPQSARDPGPGCPGAASPDPRKGALT